MIDRAPGGVKATKGVRREIGWLAVATTLGLALRCWRLDLVSFHYDGAEALAWTCEALRQGRLPLTGIVNSLGFRNPPGLEWVLAPAVALTPDPRAATVWLAMWVTSGAWPMWWLGRRLAGRLGGWVAAVSYLVLPITVFGARSLWAQFLLIPFGAWSLAGAAAYLETRRRCALLVSLALAGFATAVHLSAGAWLGGLVGWCLVEAWRQRHVQGRESRRFWLAVAGTILVVALVLAPSALDALRVRLHPPQVQPAHVAKFGMRAPLPKPWSGRLAEAFGGLFDPLSSVGVTAGIEREWPEGWFVTSRFVDVAMLCFGLVGVGGLLMGARRGTGRWGVGSVRMEAGLARLVLAWLFSVPWVAAVAVAYPNATYFYFGAPAMFAAASLGYCLVIEGGARLVGRMREVGAKFSGRFVGERVRTEGLRGESDAVAEGGAGGAKSSEENIEGRVGRGWTCLAGTCGAAVLAGIYAGLFFVSMRVVDERRWIAGAYYIPLGEQLGLVREFAREGVGRGHIVHLSGPWFQRSYDYLFHEVVGARVGERAVVMEDLALRVHQRARSQFLERALDRVSGSVRWKIFPSLAGARDFANAFYAIAPED